MERKERMGSGKVMSFIHMITRRLQKSVLDMILKILTNKKNLYHTKIGYISAPLLHVFSSPHAHSKSTRNDQGSLSSLQYLGKIAPKES